MDPSQFDRLVRSLARPASRRAALATLLAGALAGRLTPADAAEQGKDQQNQHAKHDRHRKDAAQHGVAQPKHHRRRHHARPAQVEPCPPGQKPCGGQCLGPKEPCNLPGLPGDGCRANAQPCKQDDQCCSTHCVNGVCTALLGCQADTTACTQDGDCCSANCFGQVCAPLADACGGATCPSGSTGCCSGTCCQPPANQCNTTGGIGQCCAPNCAGRECGPDGCGNGGTCGRCPSGQTCRADGTCQGKATCSPATCPTGCCDAKGFCQPGNNATYCGTGGATCAFCEVGRFCNQQTRQCEDRPGCGPENCDGCCDPATFAPNSVCRPGTTTAACGWFGANCVACHGSTAICQQGQCLCTPQCRGKQCGDDGCGGACGTCPSGQICIDPSGQCQPRCHVCPTCRYTTVQAAVADGQGPSTIRICPGVYAETITIGRPLTLVGAGQGTGAGDTVLRGAGTTVVTINPGVGPVTLQSLRITGGNAANGGGVFHQGTGLTMTDCTVTGNTAQLDGGGVLTTFSSLLTMTGCTIAGNQASNFGPDDVFGGGLSLGGNTTLAACTVSGNTTSGLGGGIALFALSGPSPGTLTLNQTNVTGNAADDGGGGIYVSSGTVTLQNGSQVTGNTPDNCVGC